MTFPVIAKSYENYQSYTRIISYRLYNFICSASTFLLKGGDITWKWHQLQCMLCRFPLKMPAWCLERCNWLILWIFIEYLLVNFYITKNLSPMKELFITVLSTDISKGPTTPGISNIISFITFPTIFGFHNILYYSDYVSISHNILLVTVFIYGETQRSLHKSYSCHIWFY